MHIAVQQGVDKINSFQADSLLPQEIDLELNKSIMRFVNLKYGKNNIYRQGFEESQKRIDDLRNLVTSTEGFVYFKERRILKFGLNPSKNSYLYIDKYSLPTNYLYHLSSYCNSFKSLSCRKNITYKLEQDSERNIIVKVKLDDLKVKGKNQARDKGWLKEILLIGGAAPSEGFDEIDSSDLSSVSNIGGANAFSMPLWNASDSNILLDLFSDSFNGLTNQYDTMPIHTAQFDCAKELLGENGLCTECSDMTDMGVLQDYSNESEWEASLGDKPIFVARVYYYKDYHIGTNDYLHDPGCGHADEVIEAVLNTSSEGVEVYYQDYQDQFEAQTFFFVLDPNVYNYILLQDDAEAISQALVDNNYSVSENNSTISTDVSGYTNSSGFTTVASVPISAGLYVGYTTNRQVYAWARENASLAEDYLAASNSATCDAESYNYDQVWGRSETISTQTPTLQIQGVMDMTTGTPIDNFIAIQNVLAYNPDIPGTVASALAGGENTLNPRYVIVEEFSIEDTIKRVHALADGSEQILNSNYWDALNNIGRDFAGVSQPIKYIQHDDILALLKDPFNKPDNGSIFGVFDGTNINVYTLIEGTKQTPLSSAESLDILPHSVKLTYLRKPKKVSLDALISSDLPEHTHQEIVAMTVSGILEGISDPRFKTQSIELNKHE